VQHSVPQQLPELEQLVVLHGDAEQTPEMHVGLLPLHSTPQPPQLKGSSSLSTQASLQHTWPRVQTLVQAPASPPPLLEPELLPLLEPLLDPELLPLELPELLPEPELLPLLEPLPEPLLDPELLPLDPLDPLLDPEPLPLPPPLELPPELPDPLPLPPLPSTEASPALPRLPVAPPQRAEEATTAASPTVQNKEERITHLPRSSVIHGRGKMKSPERIGRAGASGQVSPGPTRPGPASRAPRAPRAPCPAS
jgi:hypothetical protein